MIEQDLGMDAILDGPEAMLEWLRAQGVDVRAALGGYFFAVNYNLAAHRSLVRAVVKQMRYGDALDGCEADGDRGHQHNNGCRLDPTKQKKETSSRV